MLSSSASVHNRVLAIIDKCFTVEHLKQLHANLVTLGLGNTHFFVFKLIRCCTVRLGSIEHARHLFDKFTDPNVYMYHAVISWYAKVSDYESAVVLYRDMVRENRAKPNQFIFSIVLKAWPELLRSYGADLVHAQIVKMGYGGDQAVQTAILDAYSRYVADVSVARKVFDEMPNRSVRLWTAMISGYARTGQLENAVLLFDEMPKDIRDTPSWNSIISGCAQNGLFSEAVEFFRRMVVDERIGTGNRPNQGTFVSVLSALGNSGMLALGKSIHGYVYRNGISFDLFVLNGLIDMYGKCGNFEYSRTVFDTCLVKNETTWNSLINCYALHGRTREAIACFQDMQKEGEVRPDTVTFIGLLSACVHGEHLTEGCGYFDVMTKEYGIEPEIEHYGCLIDMLCRSGRFQEAMEILTVMRSSPDEVIWGSLLHGCKMHRGTGLAKLAVEKLIEINPRNGGYKAILANLYGEMGSWECVQKIRVAMSEGNDYKALGCSWIEVESQVHRFHSVDKSHSRAYDIYAILESLVDTCKLQYASFHAVELLAV